MRSRKENNPKLASSTNHCIKALILSSSGSRAAAQQKAADSETLIRLQKLCTSHTFVNVRFVDRDDSSFQSLILKVDSHHQSLLIDELFPMQADMAVTPGENIEITSSGGLPVQFSSTIGAIEILDGAPAYRISLPTRVRANQRREFFRVAVNRDMETRLLIDGGSCQCEILNLSNSGISFRVENNICEKIQSNRNIKDARLLLPDSSVLYCDLEVKSYEYRRPPQRGTVVGARFIDLPKTTQKQLDKLVSRLQREAKRAG